MILRNVHLFPVAQRNNPDYFTVHGDFMFKKHKPGTEALCCNLEDCYEIMLVPGKALARSEPVI
jgi:hypothetical protein